MNNADFDGHSTFGHLVLLNDYEKKMRPGLILFLIGINDVESDQPSFHDKLNTREHTRILNLLLNMVRGWHAQEFNNTTNSMLAMNNNNQLVIPEEAIQKRLSVQKSYLDKFHERLAELADTCPQYKITPVFITQPNQFGIGIDSVTGTSLESYKLDNNMNGKLLWRLLELYNDVTRNTTREKKIDVIDLANLLPKNSRYFYDNPDFTNEGAEKIATLIKNALCPLLQKKFPGYQN